MGFDKKKLAHSVRPKTVLSHLNLSVSLFLFSPVLFLSSLFHCLFLSLVLSYLSLSPSLYLSLSLSLSLFLSLSLSLSLSLFVLLPFFLQTTNNIADFSDF